jgi:hypothetical protein
MKEGNCYTVSEAAYHILGGKVAGWKPAYVHMPNEKVCHWFLIHSSGLVLDLSRQQFFGRRKPNYMKAIGSGFLTKYPSKAARKMMSLMTWKEEITKTKEGK